MSAILLGGESYEPILPPTRPWTEFFGTVGVPSVKRLESNILYYQSNYLVISLLISLLSILFYRIVVIVGPIIVFMFHFCFYRQAGEVKVGKFRITKNMVLLSSSVATVFFILITGHWKNLIASYFVSTFVVLSHLLMRDRSVNRGRTMPTASNANNRIFDPDEMLRRDNMERRSQYGATTVTGSSMTPQSTYTPPTVNNSPSNANQDASKNRSAQAAQREKQREIRQRIREQYGLS